MKYSNNRVQTESARSKGWQLGMSKISDSDRRVNRQQTPRLIVDRVESSSRRKKIMTIIIDSFAKDEPGAAARGASGFPSTDCARASAF